MTLSPDGNTVYVVGSNGAFNGSLIQGLFASTGALAVSAPIPMGLDDCNLSGAQSITATPDGQTLVAYGANANPSGKYVTTAFVMPASNPSLGYPVVLSNMGAPGSSCGNSGVPDEQGIAMIPDQAPVASFSAAIANAGTATTFNAGSSNVSYGSITSYHWVFGDGASQTTGGPTTSHVYAASGNYTVNLTEADSIGNSVPPAPGSNGLYPVDTPGMSPYILASPSAHTSRVLGIPGSHGQPPPPTTAPPTTTTVPGKGHPLLKLTPAVGPPGTIVTVTGGGFPANKNITVAWTLSTGSVTVKSDAHGNLPKFQLLILVPDILGPRFAQAAGYPSAKAPFLVAPSSEEPGGSGASYLFRSEGP
jgi:PKD repeat protein